MSASGPRSFLRRAREAATMLLRHAPLGSWVTLLSTYAATVRDPFDHGVVDLRVRIAGRRMPLRMRRGDLYTLAEVLYERQYAIVDELPARPTILDAGANVGITALWFLAHRPGCRLVCFEPAPDNLELLQANVAPWPEVVVEAAALAGKPGTVRLRLAGHGALHAVEQGGTDPSGAPGHRSGPAGREAGPADGSEAGPAREGAAGSENDGEAGPEGEVEPTTVEVPAVGLADYLEQHAIERVDLLKLDVEGSEMEVVEAAGEALSRIDRIAGEIHEDRVDPGRFLRLLRERGLSDISTRAYPSAEREPVTCFEARR